MNNISIEDFSILFSGVISFKKSGITPNSLQQMLVKNYTISNGLFQELLHTLLYSEPLHNSKIYTSSIFGTFSDKEIDSLVDVIKKEGYVELPKRIPEETVEKIKDSIKSLNYEVVNYDDTRKTVNRLNLEDPNCIIAHAFERDLLKNKEINAIIFDPVLQRIISKYLNINVPELIHLCLWWTFKSEMEASSEAAQLYHFDLDHLKWLKVFIYLTHVGEENGPHEYIPKSHNVGSKNYKLLERGYGRVKDSEMQKFQRESSKKICSKAGSVIIGDTKCFHKGNPVLADPRLILQPTFGPSELLKNIKG